MAQDENKRIVFAVVLLFLFGAAYWMGSRNESANNARATEQLRQRIERAGELNRSLSDDNERLRAENRQLGEELDRATVAAEESYRLAEELGSDNRQTIGNLETAREIVARLRGISREIRTQNQQTGAK